jgi:hypothetical protein
MNRTFDVTLSAVMGARASGSVFVSDAPVFDVSVSDTPAPVGDAEELRKLKEANFTVQWERLSPGGAWMLRVFVGDALVDMPIHDDPENALSGRGSPAAVVGLAVKSAAPRREPLTQDLSRQPRCVGVEFLPADPLQVALQLGPDADDFSDRDGLLAHAAFAVRANNEIHRAVVDQL